MKTRKMLVILVLALAIMVWVAEVSEAGPMGTAFTYQGHLYDANHVADGLYDFQFKLYDANSGGSQIGSDVNVADEDVIDALFTVELDFGSSVFDGNAIWLEIGVRPGDMNDPNVYTVLSPRQEVTPVPYALQTRGLFVDNDGNVGIGTKTPNHKLDVAGHINSSESYKLDGETVLSNSGTLNIFVGQDAGVSITTGNGNSAVGWRALYSNTTGYWNSAVGWRALYSNTTGYWNSAMGLSALMSNTTGFKNSAVGFEALRENTTGWHNSAMGVDALRNNTTGKENSAVGYQALWANGTGHSNSAMGVGALRQNTAGFSNSAVGFEALRKNTSGNYNSAMGNYALWANTTGHMNSAMGYRALSYNTTGDDNSAVGAYALQQNTTGYSNSAMGYYALRNNTTGKENSAMGWGALYYNTEGSNNSVMGRAALYHNTTGSNNSAMGFCALNMNTTGGWNSAMGYRALNGNTTGNYNTAVGYGANYNNQEGSRNTIIGYLAGQGTALHNKSGNVFLGYQAGYNETGDNKLYIANSDTSTPLIYGDFATNRVGIARVAATNAFEVEGNASKSVAGDWLANSDARIKADVQTITNALQRLDKVRLVSFKYNDDYRSQHSSIEDRRYMNVLAQEFRQVFPEYVKSSRETLANGEEILQVDAYPLTVYSAAAVQELHAIVKDKDAEIAELKERLSKLETMMAKFARQQEGGI